MTSASARRINESDDARISLRSPDFLRMTANCYGAGTCLPLIRIGRVFGSSGIEPWKGKKSITVSGGANTQTHPRL
jgi:hypothetical protein